MNSTVSFHFTLTKDQIFNLAVTAGAFTSVHIITKHFALVPPQLAYAAIGAITIVAVAAIRSQHTSRPLETDIYIDDFITHRAQPPNRRRNNHPPLQNQPVRRNIRRNNNVNNPNNANIVD